MQPDSGNSNTKPAATARHAAVLALVCMLAAGCAGGGIDFDRAKPDAGPDSGPDAGIVTGSLPEKRARSGDTGTASDLGTIRNAVSSADLAHLSPDGIAWANSDTGSAGVVTAISETRRDGVLCRGFSTRMETYAGVALYRGETCLGADGEWWMRVFEPV